MKIVRSILDLRAARRGMLSSVGLVPTMGYLHEGHLSLVDRARRENDRVVATIFVNPTQFGPNEDFTIYPRDEPRDLALLQDAGVDLVFIPTTEEMYPPASSTVVDVAKLSGVLEGAFRPGHFRGVATVVAKLFNLVAPTRAYFGQKDAQQVLVIKRMVADLMLDLEVIVCPTVREADGLATSSRNVYLSPDERHSAGVLSRALFAARDRWFAGERDGEALRRLMREVIGAVPEARIDYVSLADMDTLAELDRLEGPALASLAVKIGRTRLIDNVVLGATGG